MNIPSEHLITELFSKKMTQSPGEKHVPCENQRSVNQHQLPKPKILSDLSLSNLQLNIKLIETFTLNQELIYVIYPIFDPSRLKSGH